MFYSDELVEEIRSRTDIVDLISGYVTLQKKGSNYWGCCPFHNEKTPSFSVSTTKQMYYCFGCHASGNAYTFLMKYENYTFPEAVRFLGGRAGVALPEGEESAEQRARRDKRSRLLEVNKEAATYFYYMLRSPQGKVGMQYLEKRKLSPDTMHHFGLGYAGKSGDALVAHLRSKGFTDGEIKDSGVAMFSEKRGLSSQFWNRVMFPISDANHRVIGFGGRVMGDGEPKYLNSPETMIFDKRRNLYGLNFARSAHAGNIILCEGYMDVIAMHQAGFTQAVASLGTAFTAEQAMLLKRYSKNILLAYDSDGAGVKAALRGIGILREAGLTGKVINMRPYKDPDEFIKNLGKEAFEERIDRAENSFFFEARILSEQYDQSDPEQRTEFQREIARKLTGFSEDLERENYLSAIAVEYSIKAEDLRKLVIKYASQNAGVTIKERPKSGIQKKVDREENARRSQRLLLTWLADDPGLYGIVSKYISPEDFTEELYRTVAEMFFTALAGDGLKPAAIISRFEDEEQQREVATLFHSSLPPLTTKQERERALHDIIYGVKSNSYQYYTARLGSDVDAIAKTLEGKKTLEELAKVHITIP